MKSLASIEKLFPVFVLGLLVGAVGCGFEANSNIESVDLNSQSAVGAPDATVETGLVTARNLTGVWLGEAVMDPEKLKQQVAQLAPEIQEIASAKAKSFLSTVMAMEFREDGIVESEVELVSTQGKVLRAGSFAQWQVLESRPNGLLVQVKERLDDGTISTTEQFYQFSGDRNQIAINVPVSQELGDCDAMIVFDRKILPPTNVAAGIKTTLTK